MAAPTKYQRAYSFAGFQATNPNRPLPGASVDNELEGVERSIAETVNAINDIRRADGALKNGIVTKDALAPGLSTGVDPATQWVTGTAYTANNVVFFSAAFYRCLQSHTSGTFATDLSSDYWEIFADFSGYFTDVENWRDDAVAAAADAASDAAVAASSASTASTAASTASTAATSAAATYDLFDDRYLGEKTSLPTLDNDGNALVNGALVSLTGSADPALDGLYVRRSGVWQAAVTETAVWKVQQSYTATAGQTSFTVTGGYTAGEAMVFLNGSKLVNGDDVNVSSGSTFVLAVGASDGDSVDFVGYRTFDVGVVNGGSIVDGTVTASKLASGAAAANLGYTPENSASKNAANGYAGLDSGSRIPNFTYLPQYDPTITGTSKRDVDAALRENVVNFAWFDPDKTGSADCTSSLQNAFTYLQSLGGGTLFVPQGTYKITGFITVAGFGIRIWMESRTTKFFLSKTNSFLFVFTGDYDFFELQGGQIIQDGGTTPTNGSPIELQATGPYGCFVNNMVIVNTFGGVATTLTSGSVNQLVVRDTSMLQMRNRGIYVANAVDFTFDNVTVELDDYANGKYSLHIDSSCDGGHVSDFKATKGQYGVYCSNLLGGGVSPRHINFDWVRADGNDDVCWKIDALFRSHMINCWAASVQTGAKGAQFSGSGVKTILWTGGQFSNIATNCVDIIGAADNVNFHGVTFQGWARDAANDAIVTDGNANKSFAVANCRFYNDSDFPGSERSGVVVNSGTYRSYNISNNTGIGLSAATVVDSGTASVSKVVTGNIG